MERKDAIEILTDMYNYYSNTDDYDSYVPFDKEDKEALEIAIKRVKDWERLKEYISNESYVSKGELLDLIAEMENEDE